jgi:peroxiredoxin
MTVHATAPPAADPVPRRPRKLFLVVGLVVAAVLGVLLFTSVGTSKTSGPPRAGGPVPSFSAPRLNGSGTVQVASGGDGAPAVLLFFGKWCTICTAELPPLAVAVRHQLAAGGDLSNVHVIGVDSEDTKAVGQAFVASMGITFPVVRDPDTLITSGDFYFEGDPNAVFVKADGTISAIVHGALSVAQLTAEEKKLIPSGS